MGTHVQRNRWRVFAVTATIARGLAASAAGSSARAEVVLDPDSPSARTMEELTTTRVHSRTNDKTSVFSDAKLTDLATAAKSTGKSLSTLKQIHRGVDAAVNPVVGQTACHWGRTTGYSCSTIESTNFCVDYANWEVACNWNSTVTQIDQPGDSGGPWFLGTTAIGIHSGGGAGMSLFTRIGAATGFLDATVLQQ